ncbi:MAG: hypothetical protein ABJB11_18625 [Ferruginibacter sp.]
MKHFATIIILVLFNSLLTSAQRGEELIKNKIEQADSILLVSHEDTQGISLVNDLGKSIPLPKLIVSNKPNYKIFKESHLLSNQEKDTLIRILQRPFKDREIVIGKCFVPHHTIFIFKNGKTSYIDICFECLGFETSADLKELYAFDNQKWTELENYFIKLNFKYKLTNNEERDVDRKKFNVKMNVCITN